MKKKAASISYLKEQIEVPIVSAIGEGEFAEKIIEKARENGLRIVEDKNFFQYEKFLKAGKTIPKEVYDIVIEILISIIKTNRK